MSASPVMIEDRKLRDILTPREMDIVRGISEGKSNRQIAKLYGLTEHTVKNYIFRLCAKLNCQNRVVIAVRFVREECKP